MSTLGGNVTELKGAKPAVAASASSPLNNDSAANGKDKENIPIANGASSESNQSTTKFNSATTSSTVRKAVEAEIKAQVQAAQEEAALLAQAQAQANGADNQMLSNDVHLLIEGPSGRVVRVDPSPLDTVIDVRAFLLDHPDTCDLTCYHLEHNGTTLHDLVELAQYEELCDGKPQKLLIVPDMYEEKSARLHVRRFRELLINPPAHIVHTNIPAVSALDKLKKDKDSSLSKTKSKKKNEKNNEGDSLLLNENFLEQLIQPANKENSNIQLPFIYQATNDKKNQNEECIKSLTFSGWNPPPGNRRLRGDLLYLSLTTLENVTVHITSGVDGFYVNDSTDTNFSPLPSTTLPFHAHSLLDLVKRLSASFTNRFEKLLKRTITIHPLQQMTQALNQSSNGSLLTFIPNGPQYALPWLANEKPHTLDYNRADDTHSGTHGVDARGITRDWNEEYQSCRELPCNPLNGNDRLMRDRAFYRIYSDFVEAASRASIGIINGHIPPVNPLDAGRQHVFIYNNIFFSFAIDINELATGSNVGTVADRDKDKVTYSMSSKDLAALQWINSFDLPNLYTIATALIDYRGYRIIAQSIIPGIFHGDRVSKHVYGSMDHGLTIEAKPEFHSQLTQLANKLHIKQHNVSDSKGNVFGLATCVDSKGIVGSDGRSYLLDLFRVCPRDLNYPIHHTHSSNIHRKELVVSYCRKLALKQISAKKDGETSDEKEVKEKVPEEEEEQLKYLEAFYKISFNPDAFTQAKLADTPERIAADEAEVKGLSSYLVDEIIPNFVKNLKSADISPVDGFALTKEMHSRGINMRYLGKIATLLNSPETSPASPASASPVPHLYNLCISEMISRVVKRLLSATLRDVIPDKSRRVEQWHVAPVVARFLSALLGSGAFGNGFTDEAFIAAKQVVAQINAEKVRIREDLNGLGPVNARNKKNKHKKDKITLSDGRNAPSEVLHPINLWQAIREEVSEKFGFNLPNHLPFTSRMKLSLLRNIAIKTGIQLKVRVYDLSLPDPVTVDDIMELVPVVKGAWPRSMDASDLLDTGRAYLAQGRLQSALQFLMEALQHITMVYGPIHIDAAECYSMLAYIYHKLYDLNQALDYQQRAIIIHERVSGIDSPDTAYAHMHMALYLHQNGNNEAALIHQTRATIILELCGGFLSPDTATAHMNSALLLQESAPSKHQQALLHTQSALERTMATLGDNHLHTALNHHAVAIAQFYNRNYRAAITSEKQSKSLFVNVLGGKHSRVTTANAWLSHFTECAVKTEQDLPQPILPLQLAQTSPVSWTTMRSYGFKGGNTSSSSLEFIHDMLNAIEVSANRREQYEYMKAKEEEEKLRNPQPEVEAPTNDSAAAGPDDENETNDSSASKLNRKQKRKGKGKN